MEKSSSLVFEASELSLPPLAEEVIRERPASMIVIVLVVVL